MTEVIDHKLILYVDGAARGNPGHAGIGGIVTNINGEVLLEISEYIGETTNNIAEYSALIFVLQSLPKFNAKELEIYSDSELLVHQLNGSYKVKNQNLKVYFGWAKTLLGDYRRTRIVHVDRSKNKTADKLANEAIDEFLSGEKKQVTFDKLPEQKQLF